MKYEFSFTYLSCQSCTAKIHCEKCAEEIMDRLLLRGIEAAEIDIANKQIAVLAPGLDEMDVLDLLEEVSIFAD
ncbi:MAG: hypothetical protein IJ466_05365 [Clostridia bacterium]|nr:hypothetical protein [Clostridia bacterium]